MTLREHRIRVARTARYSTLRCRETPRQVWFLLHGYGQLAREFALTVEHAFSSVPCLLVAPEGHSRFYLPGHKQVGASWMTRDFRDEEIDDYVHLLEHIAAETVPELLDPDANPVESSLGAPEYRSGPIESTDPVHVPGKAVTPALGLLGYSQGAATACRWIAASQRRFNHIVLWGGLVPPDIDRERFARSVAGSNLVLAVGTDDPFLAPDLDRNIRRLTAAHIPHRVVTYEGGHSIDTSVLRSIAESC